MAQNIVDLRKFKDEPDSDSISAKRHIRPDPSQTVHFSWEAYEYEKLNRDSVWFLALIVLTLGFAAFSVFIKNYLFAFFIILAGLLVGYFAKREPKTVRFGITSEGIRFGERLYLFEDLKSFWVFYDPPLFKEINIESKKSFMPHLRAPLGDADPEKIRETLNKFLPETKREAPFVSILSRFFRF